jgi:serine protease inhibitor
MGIHDVFESYANLSKISTSSEVFLSRLIHKAKIEVNEEGTLAVAVTAALFSNKASPPRFLANRPFIYFIVDKATNLLLFSGTVKNPENFNFKV